MLEEKAVYLHMDYDPWCEDIVLVAVANAFAPSSYVFETDFDINIAIVTIL